MAKTIIEDEQLSRYSLRSWVRIILYGAAVGALYWLLALVLSQFVVEPLACRNLTDAEACVNATAVAGRMATVLIAALAIVGMVRLGVTRPVVVAVAAAIVLWDLSTYVEGLFWLEGAAWSIVLYAAAYALFGWIARSTSTVVAVIFAAVIAIVIRIALIS